MRLPNCLVLLAFFSSFTQIQSRERSNLSPLIPPPGRARPLPPCPVIEPRGLPGPRLAPPCRVVEPRPPSVPAGLIRVNITCDNKLWFYAGHQPVVDGSTPGQGNWRVTKHVGAPPGTKVYGIKCEDFHVVAGIIASFEDGTVTDGTWKCTSVTPGANWLSENYDDSSWQPAHVIHTNNASSYYWGIRPNISSAAQWIWTDGWTGQDRTVYCRKVVQDIINVNITCDNKLWFYADGETIIDESTPGQDNWRTIKQVTVPADTKVYGIKCRDFHVVAGIIASFSDGSTTDHTWKCTSVTPGANWLSENYDDSSWQPAHVIHTNNASSYYWGIRPDISSAAQWIWTDGWKGQDRTVYCRKVVQDIINVNITCDNKLWFYADGETIIDESTPGQDNWRTIKQVTVPADTKVYGIKCRDFHVVAGIIASFSDGDITDSSWRCTNTDPGAGWLTEVYDDSNWTPAYTIHTNNAPSYYWGLMSGVSSNAKWIWTRGWHGMDKTVYCRKVKGAFSTRPFVLPDIGLPRGTGNVRHPRGDRIKPDLEPVRPRF